MQAVSFHSIENQMPRPRDISCLSHTWKKVSSRSISSVSIPLPHSGVVDPRIFAVCLERNGNRTVSTWGNKTPTKFMLSSNKSLPKAIASLKEGNVHPVSWDFLWNCFRRKGCRVCLEAPHWMSQGSPGGSPQCTTPVLTQISSFDTEPQCGFQRQIPQENSWNEVAFSSTCLWNCFCVRSSECSGVVVPKTSAAASFPLAHLSFFEKTLSFWIPLSTARNTSQFVAFHTMIIGIVSQDASKSLAAVLFGWNILKSQLIVSCHLFFAAMNWMHWCVPHSWKTRTKHSRNPTRMNNPKSSLFDVRWLCFTTQQTQRSRGKWRTKQRELFCDLRKRWNSEIRPVDWARHENQWWIPEQRQMRNVLAAYENWPLANALSTCQRNQIRFL